MRNELYFPNLKIFAVTGKFFMVRHKSFRRLKWDLTYIEMTITKLTPWKLDSGCLYRVLNLALFSSLLEWKLVLKMILIDNTIH